MFYVSDAAASNDSGGLVFHRGNDAVFLRVPPLVDEDAVAVRVGAG